MSKRAFLIKLDSKNHRLNRITEYDKKEELLTHEQTLKDAGLIEGKSYQWEPNGKKWALFVRPLPKKPKPQTKRVDLRKYKDE